MEDALPAPRFTQDPDHALVVLLSPAVGLRRVWGSALSHALCYGEAPMDPPSAFMRRMRKSELLHSIM